MNFYQKPGLPSTDTRTRHLPEQGPACAGGSGFKTKAEKSGSKPEKVGSRSAHALAQHHDPPHPSQPIQNQSPHDPILSKYSSKSNVRMNNMNIIKLKAAWASPVCADEQSVQNWARGAVEPTTTIRSIASFARGAIGKSAAFFCYFSLGHPKEK